MAHGSCKSAVIVLLWLLLALPAAAAPVLVDGDWLSARLTDPDIVIVDMSSDDTQYLRFHLPGAVRLPYEAIVKDKRVVPPGCVTPECIQRAPAYKVRLDDRELAAVLGRIGISRRHHVVIYDDIGGLNAGRLFWELERIGHPSVSVLDGGLVSWILQGRKVVNNSQPRLPSVYAIDGAGRRNEAQLADVRPGNGTLLDTRSDEEYAGDLRYPRTGHVPGARWLNWEDTVNWAQGFRRKPESELRQKLAQLGVTKTADAVIAYCRSGHRAAQMYLTLRSLGFSNVRLYANSMNEYGLKADAPLKLGPAP